MKVQCGIRADVSPTVPRLLPRRAGDSNSRILKSKLYSKQLWLQILGSTPDRQPAPRGTEESICQLLPRIQGDLNLIIIHACSHCWHSSPRPRCPCSRARVCLLKRPQRQPSYFRCPWSSRWTHPRLLNAAGWCWYALSRSYASATRRQYVRQRPAVPQLEP